jgi:EmrB/QacA subfamily drug resistance transporter
MTTPPETAGHPRRWLALIILSLSLVAVTLDNSVLNTALPSLAKALHASTSDLQWITDAYTLSFAAILILAGNLGARLGSRRALMAGLAVFAGGSTMAALSTGSTELIVWRAVMGLGAAFVMPATLAIIMRIFPARERPKAFAVWSAAAGIGVLIGPVTGGALLEHFSWSSAFWINVPVVAIALTGIFLVVPAIGRQVAGRLDLPAAIISTLALALLVDAIVEAPQRGWLSAVTVTEFAAFAVLTAAFIGWELRRDEPMVQVRLFANRGFVIAAVALSITFFALFGALFVMSQYLQLVHGYSTLKAGLGAMPFAVAMAATSGTSNLFTAKLGTRGTLTLGLVLVAAGLGAFSTITVTSPFVVVAVLIAVVGAGMGMMMAPASLQITASVPVRYASMAGSLNSVVRELGGVLGIAVVGSVVSASYRHTMTSPKLPAPISVAGKDLPTAHGVARELPARLAGPLLNHADHAFTSAMNHGTLVAASIAGAGAIMVLVGLPRHTDRPETAETEQAELVTAS